MDNDWLKELKVGDQFYTEEFGRYTIYTVKRFTNTEIVTEPFNNSTIESTRFSRESGREVGAGGWHTKYARRLTLEVKDKIRRLRRLNAIKSYEEWYKLSDEDLALVYGMIRKYRKE